MEHIRAAIAEYITDQSVAAQEAQEAQERAEKAFHQRQAASLRDLIKERIPADVLDVAFVDWTYRPRVDVWIARSAPGLMPASVQFAFEAVSSSGERQLRISAEFVTERDGPIFAQGLFTIAPNDTPDQARNVIIALLAQMTTRLHEHLEREAERTTAIAAAEVEHTRATHAYQEVLEQARAALWQWPQGVAVTLHRWQWCTAPASLDGEAEYDWTYSLQDALVDGWLTPASGGSPIRLLPEHLPVVQRFTLQSIADAHTISLTRPTVLQIPGFAEEERFGTRYLYVASEAELSGPVVHLPVGWLQRLVGQVAAEQ